MRFEKEEIFTSFEASALRNEYVELFCTVAIVLATENHLAFHYDGDVFLTDTYTQVIRTLAN